MLTKAEMEDIWQNKPVGYFSTFKKNFKGTKHYKIALEPYTYAKMQREVFEVRAKNVEYAVSEAKIMLRQKYPNLAVDGYFVNNIT